MIIGDYKGQVIGNIREAIEKGEYNNKVEVNDPKLSLEQKKEIINTYLNRRYKLSYKFNNKVARTIHSVVSNVQNKETKILGIRNVRDIKTGAIITSNHFNPLDNTIIKTLTKRLGKKRLYIVGQESNLAMDGFVGYMMNYSDIIPISSGIDYMKKEFPEIIKEKLDKKEYVLIYPEQEMWFNYRKPRPLKSGAYHYAAKNNVPIISCFVEIIDKDEPDNMEFYKVKYVLHVLDPIYPDSTKTLKQNTMEMMEQDYKQKKEAYEKAYNKELNYDFKVDDIAGWIQIEDTNSEYDEDMW